MYTKITTNAYRFNDKPRKLRRQLNFVDIHVYALNSNAVSILLLNNCNNLTITTIKFKSANLASKHPSVV